MNSSFFTKMSFHHKQKNRKMGFSSTTLRFLHSSLYYRFYYTLFSGDCFHKAHHFTQRDTFVNRFDLHAIFLKLTKNAYRAAYAACVCAAVALPFDVSHLHGVIVTENTSIKSLFY